MKKGKIVSKKSSTNHTHHTVGAVTDTEVRTDGWRYLQVQWISDGNSSLPSLDRTEWVRHDEVLILDPFMELKRIQDAMLLSSAILSENFEKTLRKQNEAD